FWYGKNGIDTKKQVIRNTTGFTSTFLDNTFHVKGDFTFRNNYDNVNRRRVQVPYSNKPGSIAYVGTTTNDLSFDNRATRYIASNVYSEYENTFKENHYLKALVG